jgi:hypothetical protein
MTTIKAIRLASLVTAINVLVASGFSIAAIIRPQYLVPAESVPTEASLLLAMYAAARTIPVALFALGAIYKQATPALLILGALAGAMQLLDAGIGLFEHDIGKCAGPTQGSYRQTSEDHSRILSVWLRLGVHPSARPGDRFRIGQCPLQSRPRAFPSQ